MSPRPIVNPTVNEHGDEQHPAWALIGAHRVSSTPGAVLFDSDLHHQHYVAVSIRAASRRRDLHRDWLHGHEEYIEVAMSEAQWASFVSSMNVGDGVPCTVERRGREQVPGMPYQPRLAESMDEVDNAADEALQKINDAFEKYREHKTVTNLRALEFAIKHAPSNMRFAAQSLSEHAENVVQRSRADIEAMVMVKAQQLGIEPGELGVTGQLVSGNPEHEEKS
jgi:hypothetical protein